MGSRTIGFGVRRIWVRDRGRRISAAIGVRDLDSQGVRDLGSQSGFAIWVRDDRGSRSGFATIGVRKGFAIWVRDLGSRNRTAKSNGCEVGRRTDRPLSLLPLSLSLSLRAGASSSPSALSLFSGKFLFEGKIETEINLHPFKGQMKSISGKCIFRAQPNTRKKVKSISGNAFHPKQTQP